MKKIIIAVLIALTAVGALTVYKSEIFGKAVATISETVYNGSYAPGEVQESVWFLPNTVAMGTVQRMKDFETGDNFIQLQENFMAVRPVTISILVDGEELTLGPVTNNDGASFYQIASQFKPSEVYITDAETKERVAKAEMRGYFND